MRKFGWLIALGALLMVAAVVLCGYNLWDDWRAGDEVRDVMSQLEQARPTEPESTQPSWSGQFGILPGGKVPDYVLRPNMDMPAVEIGGHRYIGTVSIPALGLELPVMEDWSYPKMKIAPCRYTGSAYLHNLVIVAHNYNAHFGRLESLAMGELVIFTDMDGNMFTYTVEQREILQRTAVEEMQEGDWDLTLFTCTVGGAARVTIRCKLKTV